MFSIEANGLTKKFGYFTAVNNVSFNVRKGEIFGFLGANGAGKTTTIKMLCGILEPTEGDAFVGGFSVRKEPDKVKKVIGYMSQKFSLYDDLTVGENIEFFGGIYGLEGRKFKERKNFILKMADLKGRENFMTGDLPGGIKQRLALGTAILHSPQIVFLDEPTSGVDPIARRNFWNLITEFAQQGITLLVTTHYLEEAEYCNNIILMDSGKIIANGTAQELKTNFLKKTVLEISCSKPVVAIEILERENFVDETSIFGNRIHTVVNRHFESENKIKNILSHRDIEVFEIEKIVPTLEDVFIHLLEGEKT
jgi:ABC-2 type transport system ATP-binding protein